MTRNLRTKISWHCPFKRHKSITEQQELSRKGMETKREYFLYVSESLNFSMATSPYIFAMPTNPCNFSMATNPCIFYGYESVYFLWLWIGYFSMATNPCIFYDYEWVYFFLCPRIRVFFLPRIGYFSFVFESVYFGSRFCNFHQVP